MVKEYGKRVVPMNLDESRADWRPFTIRKVRTHIKALTYAPKIPAVLSGEVRQTIRPEGNVGSNDIILFHGWQGKPYRSPWSWRLKVQLTLAYNIEVFSEGIIHGDIGKLIKWSSQIIDNMAKSDGIIPQNGESPGEAMGNLFNKMYVLPSFGHDKAGKWFTVLIWDWPPIERNFSNEICLKVACDAALAGKPKITWVLDESKLVRMEVK